MARSGNRFGQSSRLLDLYKNSVAELSNALADFQDNAGGKLAGTVHVVYKLRRLFDDDYPYLREYIEINHPEENQKDIRIYIVGLFRYKDQAENNDNKKSYKDNDIEAVDGVDTLDMLVFKKYFCSSFNQKKTNLAKQEGIKGIDRRIKKIQKIIDKIIMNENWKSQDGNK